MGFLPQAEETLKTFEKKDSRGKSAAATKLSFLYFLARPSHSDYQYYIVILGKYSYVQSSLAYFLELYGICRSLGEISSDSSQEGL
jgi:hypothetical protein